MAEASALRDELEHVSGTERAQAAIARGRLNAELASAQTEIAALKAALAVAVEAAAYESAAGKAPVGDAGLAATGEVSELRGAAAAAEVAGGRLTDAAPSAVQQKLAAAGAKALEMRVSAAGAVPGQTLSPAQLATLRPLSQPPVFRLASESRGQLRLEEEGGRASLLRPMCLHT